MNSLINSVLRGLSFCRQKNQNGRKNQIKSLKPREEKRREEKRREDTSDGEKAQRDRSCWRRGRLEGLLINATRKKTKPFYLLVLRRRSKYKKEHFVVSLFFVFCRGEKGKKGRDL